VGESLAIKKAYRPAFQTIAPKIASPPLRLIFVRS
jgi:hypothetical protein